MKMIAARCTGVLALALLGQLVSVKADSIHVDAVPSGYLTEGGDFALPAAAPQPKYSREQHGAIRCCALRAWAGTSFLDDFSLAPERLNAQSGNRGLAVSTNAAVGLAKSASFGLATSATWDRSEAIDGDILSNEFAIEFENEYGKVNANFAASAESGALNGGYGSFASPWIGIPSNSALFEDASGGAEPRPNNFNGNTIDKNIDGNGKTIRTGPVGVKRGDGGLPVTRKAPLAVSEPSMLALLMACLAAVGLLMLKRTT
jgi:hypothetical protein